MDIKEREMSNQSLRRFFEKDAERILFFEHLPKGYHHSRRLDQLLAMLKKIAREDMLILDVGCGDGWHDHYITNLGFNIVGLDISTKRISRAKRIVKADFLVGDATKMPFRDDYFDMIICTELLEHASEPQKIVKDIARITKKRGYVFFETPSKSNIADILLSRLFKRKQQWGLEMDIGHLHFFDCQSLQSMFNACGFEVEKVRGAPCLRWYGMPYLESMFWNKKYWPILGLIENIIRSVPKLNRYGAIQQFLCRKLVVY